METDPHCYLSDVFWTKVKKTDGCWAWTACCTREGYGRIMYKRKNWLAHRLVWASIHGPIPVGLEVLHECDNPPCCNPSHLFLGTQAENNADMVRKGRQARGETSGARKHPELLARGETSGARKHPELLARGARSGRYTHPERTARGERHGRAKLTEADIRSIRASEGVSRLALAEKYGVSRRMIDAIYSRHSWAHIS